MNQLITYLGGHALTTNDAEFMQDGIKEAIGALVKSQLVSDNKTILDGVVVTKATNDYTHTEGYIYYDGEVYKVDALVSALTDSGTPKFKIETTYPANNPVTYQSGDNKYVHHYRKMKLVVNTDPDGLFDYNAIKTIKWHRFNRDKDIGDIHHQVGVVTDFFDTGTGLGKVGTKFEGKWALADGQGGRLNAKGRSLVGFDTADSDYNAADGSKSGGAKTRTIDATKLPTASPWTINDPGHSHGLTNGTAVFRFTGAGSTNNVPGGGWDGVNLSVQSASSGVSLNSNAGGGQPLDVRAPYVTVIIAVKIS